MYSEYLVCRAKEYIRLLTKGIEATTILSEFYNNTVVLKVLFRDNKWYTVTVEMDEQQQFKKTHNKTYIGDVHGDKKVSISSYKGNY